jgi:imidazolonepropionase-like amidohydrolase
MSLAVRHIVIGLVALVMGTTLTAQSGPVLVLPDVTVIDGHGGDPRPRMTVVVADGLIADIHPTGEKPIASDAQVLDVQGQYIIPGLIDSHVHVTLHPDQTTAGLAHLLRGGVTAVRDMGGDSAWLAELSETTASPTAAGPRVSFAVPLGGPLQLGKPRPQPFKSGTAKSGTAFNVISWLTTFADQTPVARAVAFIKGTGATGIKLYSDIPTSRVRELAVESRRQGLKVWSHARIFPGKPSDAVEAGVEVLSHSSYIACEVAQKDEWCDHAATVESAAIDRLLSRMRERGTILEPTLATLRKTASGGLDPTKDPKRMHSVPATDFATRLTRKAHAYGVRIVAGSDLELKPDAAAPAIHDEMELLVAAGLTPLEAITAATRTGAEVLGLDSVSGTLEPGKRADFVVLAADPTRNIRNTRTVTHVIKGGHVAVAKTITR